jgi:hypothetical protein
MNMPQSSLSRRKFLFAVGASSATATVAMVSGTNTGRETPDPTQRAGQGYRLTEHIRNYYRTAKV